MNKMIALFCAAVIAVSSSSAIVMAEDAENSGTQTVNEVSDNTADNTDTEENTDSEADGDTEDDTDASDENDADSEDNTDADDENDADSDKNTNETDKNDPDTDAADSTDTDDEKESDEDDESQEPAKTAAPDADEAVSATDAPEETDQPSATDAPAEDAASATAAPEGTDQPSATDAPAEDAASATAAPAASTVRSSGGGGGGSIAATAEPAATADPTATAEPTATTEPTTEPTATAKPTVTEKPEKDTEKNTTQTVVVMKKPFTLVKKYDDNPFDDCQSGWFKNYVSFAYANGIIKGYSDNTFDPFGKITGSQLAVMLYRISTGKADMVTEGDVWAEEALAWVKANGIMADFADDDFNADDVLTREEIICSLYRSYGLYNKAEEGGKIDKDRFPDAGKVSEFALPAMKWAVASKIITGKGDKWIDPLSNVTRAETATIFERYLENLEFADVPVEVKSTSAKEEKSDASTADAAEAKTDAATETAEDKTEAAAAETAEDKTEASAAETADVKSDAATETAVEPEAPAAAEAEATEATAETEAAE